MTESHRLIFSVITVFFVLVILFISFEILLRLTGHLPWRYLTKDANEPTMNEYDPLLGWKSKPGRYVVNGYTESAFDLKMTYWGGGRRATGIEEASRRDKLVLIDGSYTQGWAVSDSDTYAWKLQEKYPFGEVMNYGTAGYGTCQSLLVLEKILAHSETPPLILYGFIEHLLPDELPLDLPVAESGPAWTLYTIPGVFTTSKS